MKKIFEENFGIDVFSGSTLEKFIQQQFRVGQRKNKFTEIIEAYNTEAEPIALAQAIGQAIDEECNIDLLEHQELLQIADFLQTKLMPIINILNAENQLTQRAQALNEFVAQTIDALINKGIPAESLELRRLESIQHNMRNIIELEIAGQIVQSSGKLLKINDLIAYGGILRKIAPHLIITTSDKSSTDDAINASFTCLYHIGSGLKQPQVERLANVLRDAHWLTIIDLHQATCNESLDQVLSTMQLSLGQNTINNLKQTLNAKGISPKQAAEIFSLVQKSPLNPQLINDTRQTQKFAAASILVCDIARQIKCVELEKIALASLCVSGVRQFYSEITLMESSPDKLVSLTQSTGIILETCGQLTENKTLSLIGQGILSGVAAYNLALAIPGGAVVALPLAALGAVGSLISNQRVRKHQKIQAERIKTEQQILAYVKESHTCIIALHNATNANFVKVFHELRESHEILANGIKKLSQQFALQCNSLSGEIITIKDEVHELQYTISDNFRDLYLKDILNPLATYELIVRLGLNSQTNIEETFTNLLTWVLIKSKDQALNGYNLLYNNTTQKKYIILASILQKDQELSVLGALEAYLTTMGLGQNFGLKDMPNIPILLEAIDAINYLLQEFNEQLSAKYNLEQIYENLIEKVTEIKQALINFASHRPLIIFLSEKIVSQYNHFFDKIKALQQEQPGCQDPLNDFNTIQGNLYSHEQLTRLLQNSLGFIVPQIENGPATSTTLDASGIFFNIVYPRIAHDLGLTSYLHTLACRITIPQNERGVEGFTLYLNAQVGARAENNDLVDWLPVPLNYEFSIIVNQTKVVFASITGMTFPGGARLRDEIYRSWYHMVPELGTYLCIDAALNLVTYDNNNFIRKSMYEQRKPHLAPNPALVKLLKLMHAELIHKPASHFNIIINHSNLINLIPRELLINRDQAIKASIYQQRTKIAELLEKELYNNEELTKASLYTKIINIMLSLRGSLYQMPDLAREFSKLMLGLNNDQHIMQNFRNILSNIKPREHAEILNTEPDFSLNETLQQLDEYLNEFLGKVGQNLNPGNLPYLLV